jgi:hypothetical protein
MIPYELPIFSEICPENKIMCGNVWYTPLECSDRSESLTGSRLSL